MTKMESLARFFRSRYFWLLFAAAVIFVYFFGLTVPLLGPDEPRYAQVAREMYERNDWVTTTLGGHNWFEKPALLYWLQIASFHLFGTNEFAARFGSAVFGLGTILSLWFFGKYGLKRERAISDGSFAHYLGMIAATSLGLIVFSRGASFDIILTFPITAALVGFFAFDQARESDQRQRYLGLFTFYFFIGVALLAKGLVGIVFPFAIVGLYHLLSRKLPSKGLILSGFWGVLISAAVAATWYVPMYLVNGWEFIDEFFIQHHFQRYTSNKYLHPQPFHFFFWVLPLMTIPWLPFFAAEIWRSVRSVFSDNKAKQESDSEEQFSIGPMLRFAFAWIAIPLLFFSFSGSKLPGYILPAVPGAIIIAALSAYRYSQRSAGNQVLVKGLAVVTLIVIIAIIQFALPKFAEGDSVKSMIATADEAGYKNAKVVGFVTISHNAEWYAAGRLLRDESGKQRRLNGPADVPLVLAETGGGPILVISRLELVHHLENDASLDTKRLADNGEYAIAAVGYNR